MKVLAMKVCILLESNNATTGTKWLSRVPAITPVYWIASFDVVEYILPYCSGLKPCICPPPTPCPVPVLDQHLLQLNQLPFVGPVSNPSSPVGSVYCPALLPSLLLLLLLVASPSLPLRLG